MPIAAIKSGKYTQPSPGIFPNESRVGGFYQLVSHEELEEAEQLFGVKLNYHHDTMEPWPLLAPV